MILVLLACSDGDTEGVNLENANNYAYTNTIDVKMTDCALGEDVRFDWSALTVDVQDHEMDPAADVTEMAMLYFPSFDEVDLEEAIAADDLFMSDTQVILTAVNEGATEIWLSEASDPAGNPFDPAEYFTKEEGTWAIRLTEDERLAHSVGFFRAVEGEANAEVLIDNETADVEFTPELEALEVVSIAATDSLHVDWTGVTAAGDGDFFDPNKIDQLMLGRYELSLAEIEAQFFDLELIAAELYTFDIDRTQELSLDSGDFKGFGSGESWVLALRCTSCTNPAPPFLTVIEVE